VADPLAAKSRLLALRSIKPDRLELLSILPLKVEMGIFHGLLRDRMFAPDQRKIFLPVIQALVIKLYMSLVELKPKLALLQLMVQ